MQTILPDGMSREIFAQDFEVAVGVTDPRKTDIHELCSGDGLLLDLDQCCGLR